RRHRAGQPRPGRARRAVGDDRGRDRPRHARRLRRSRARVQPRPRRAALDRSRRADADRGGGARAVTDTVPGGPEADAPQHGPWDTIVAGAGAAGLTVAHDLARRGYRVLVLEATDRLGGVATGVEVDALALDAGAESFATRGGAVAELAT